MSDEAKPQFGHEHTFVYLSRDEVPISTWGDRIGKWEVYDVFFCSGCLAYKRVKIMELEPGRHSFEREVTWRKP